MSLSSLCLSPAVSPLLLSFLFSLILCASIRETTALAPGALPSGTWQATPDLPVKYTGAVNVQVYVRNATLVVQSDGTQYAYYGAYSKTAQSELMLGRFSGTAVCADGALSHVLMSVDADSCDADNSIAPWFCQATPTYYAGVYAYGLYEGAHLEINGYGAAQWPFLFECVSDTCGDKLACNSTVNLESNFYQSGGTSIINGSFSATIFNSTIYANNTPTINFIDSRQFTVEAPGLEEIFMTNSSASVDTQGGSLNIYAQNLTASSCGGVAFFVSAELANQTFSSESSAAQLDFTSPAVPGFAEFSSDWQVLPISGNAWQYTGGSGVLYEVSVCLANAMALYINGNDTYRMGLAVAINGVVTSETFYSSSSFSLSRFTAPSAAIDTICAESMFLANSSDTISAVVSIDSLVLNTSTSFHVGRRADLPPYVIAFQAWPVSCEQRPNINQNNFTLNITFNGNITLQPGDCVYFTYSPPNTIKINAELCQEDSSTIACGAPNATTGKRKCEYVGPLANATEQCGAYCDEEGTFHVTKLCSEEPQCEVSADPPETESSPSTAYSPRLCFTCGVSLGFPSGGDTPGGDSGGLGGPPGGLPLVPPTLPIGIPGLFTPNTPGFPNIGGASPGGSGTGVSSVGGPPSPLPVVTELNPGVTTEPATSKGMKIPLVNFTASVPFCGSSSHGWIVLNIGELPETRYVCQRLFNVTYAWIPDCSCTGAANNASIYHQLTTLYMQLYSTLIGDSTSQLIWNGTALFQTLMAQDFSLPIIPHVNQISPPSDGRMHLYYIDDLSAFLVCINEDTCFPLRPWGFAGSADITPVFTSQNTASFVLTNTFAAGTYGPLSYTIFDTKGRLIGGANVSSLLNLQINDTLRLNKLAGIGGQKVTVPDGLDVQAPSLFEAEARFNGPFEVDTVPLFNAGGVVLSIASADNHTIGVGGTAANPILSFNKSSVVQGITAGESVVLSGTPTSPVIAVPIVVADGLITAVALQASFDLLPPFLMNDDFRHYAPVYINITNFGPNLDYRRITGAFRFTGYAGGATPFTQYNGVVAYVNIDLSQANAIYWSCMIEGYGVPDPVPLAGWQCNYPIDDPWNCCSPRHPSVRFWYDFGGSYPGSTLQYNEGDGYYHFSLSMIPFSG